MEKLFHVIITVVKDTPKSELGLFFLDDFSSHAGMVSHLPEEANHLFPGTLISHSSVPPALGMVSFTYLYKDRFTTYSLSNPHLLLPCSVMGPSSS